MNKSRWEDWRPQIVDIVSRLRLSGVDVDRIPYTPRFDELYSEFVDRCTRDISKNEFFWELLVVRKNFNRYRQKYGLA